MNCARFCPPSRGLPEKVPRYCINSHTAAVQKLGLDNEQLGEVLAVVGLFNQMNKLADAYQIEPDILPQVR
jgi:alkylhydroperoxidase family enzyme